MERAGDPQPRTPSGPERQPARKDEAAGLVVWEVGVHLCPSCRGKQIDVSWQGNIRTSKTRQTFLSTSFVPGSLLDAEVSEDTPAFLAVS